MQRSGVIAVVDEVISHILSLEFSAAEHYAIYRWIIVYQTFQSEVTVTRLNHIIIMTNICRSRVLLPYADAHRVFHVFVENLLNLGWHRRRKQQSVLVFWHILQDSVHVFLEAHVKHLVGLIEHHPLHVAEVDAIAAYHILQTTWRRHYDLRLLREALKLHLDACSTVYRHNKNLRDVLRIAEQILGNLHAKLTCRAKNQCLNAAVFRVDILQKRQTESSGLTSTCLCKSDQISALRQQYWKHLSLYRHRLHKS